MLDFGQPASAISKQSGLLFSNNWYSYYDFPNLLFNVIPWLFKPIRLIGIIEYYSVFIGVLLEEILLYSPYKLLIYFRCSSLLAAYALPGRTYSWRWALFLFFNVQYFVIFLLLFNLNWLITRPKISNILFYF